MRTFNEKTLVKKPRMIPKGFICFVSMVLIPCAAAMATVMPIVDGDGDGVPDERDDCPYTQPGAVVDTRGCMPGGEDQDGDGVPDFLDVCPYTPPGAVVDKQGCAIDDDFDGVANGLDQCPGSLLGAVVDARGCAGGQSPTVSVAAARQAVSAPMVAAAAPRVLVPASIPPPASTSVLAASARATLPPMPMQASVRASPAAMIRAPLIERRAEQKPATARTHTAVVREAVVLFGRRDVELSAQAQQRLDEVAANWRSVGQQGFIEVVGHADPDGESSQAESVSALRARLVRSYLLARGVPGTRIRESNEADRTPLSRESRRNRRVEVRAVAS